MGKQNERLQSTMELIGSINKVEGFYPEELAQTYTDLGSSDERMHLAVGKQKAWFRLKYPLGKIDPQVDYYKDGVCVASCRVYADYKDLPEQFLAKNTATRSYDPDKPSIPARDWAITAAIGRALTDAGFGLQFDHSGEIYPGMVGVADNGIDESQLPFTLTETKTEPEVSDEKSEDGKGKSGANTKAERQSEKPRIVKPQVSQKQEAKGTQKKETESDKGPKAPKSVDDALKMICDRGQYRNKNMTFQDILKKPDGAGLIDWICRNGGRVSPEELAAARLIKAQAKTGAA
jgi:hypothetical protein